MAKTSIWEQTFNVPQSTTPTQSARAKDDAKARAKAASSRAKKRAIIGTGKTTSKSVTNLDKKKTSSGSNITTEEDAGYDSLTGGDGGEYDESLSGDGSGSSGGATSPLLEGSMTFEELIKEICEGIDLIFICKRSTVVVTDYESLYAEAKYLRDNYHDSVQAEDIALWQLEDGSYELEVNEYGFYNTVKVNYKNGTITESYEDLVRVYGEVVAEYDDKNIDKSTAIMKAKAYLAAHVRDFEMSVKAKLLHDADIDIGDIVTLENPMTMRDKYRKETEGRDPEYFFVTANSISWEGDGGIINDIELRYGAKTPERKDIPEVGTPGYTSSGASESIKEVGELAEKISYSSACQTHDCVKSKGTGDCHGMSDFIACELKSRGIETKILQYGTNMAGNHRSVKYKDSTGNWVRFPYRQFSIDSRFRDTDAVDQGTEISKTC